MPETTPVDPNALPAGDQTWWSASAVPTSPVPDDEDADVAAAAGMELSWPVLQRVAEVAAAAVFAVVVTGLCALAARPRVVVAARGAAPASELASPAEVVSRPLVMSVQLAAAPRAVVTAPAEPAALVERLDPGPLSGAAAGSAPPAATTPATTPAPRKELMTEALVGLATIAAPSAGAADDPLAPLLVPAGPSGGGRMSGLLMSLAVSSDAALSKVRFFNAEGDGRHVVFVVDRSSGLVRARFNVVRRNIATAVRKLRMSTQFQVIFHDEGALAYPDFRWLAGRRDAANLANWLGHIETSTGNNPTPAFEKALNELSPRPDAIFFLTGNPVPEHVVNDLRRLNAGSKPVPIHAISLADPASAPRLREIARDSGGTYHHVDE